MLPLRSLLPLRCVLLAVFLLASWGGAWAAADFGKEVKPLLESYCYKCHANGKKKGDLSLEPFTSVEAIVKDQKTWGNVLENLKSGDMPPDDAKQPSADERERLIKWIDLVVFATDPDHPDPGRVTLRRLNRTEYNNTIRDLVGVAFEPGADFPADDTGYGFDNIGDALSLPPVLFERYLAAAEKVMSTAILNDHKARAVTTPVDLLTITGGPENGNTSTARRVDERESSVTVSLAIAGTYTLRFEAGAPKVGPEATKLELKCDGKPITIPPSLSSTDGMLLKLSVPIDKPGPHKLSMRVANPLAQPEKGKTASRSIAGSRCAGVDFVSPPQPVSAPETQLRIFAAGRGQPTLDASARAIVSDFAARAFRRPLQPNELERLMFIYATASQAKAATSSRACRRRSRRCSSRPTSSSGAKCSRSRTTRKRPFRSTNGRSLRASPIFSGARCPIQSFRRRRAAGRCGKTWRRRSGA